MEGVCAWVASGDRRRRARAFARGMAVFLSILVHVTRGCAAGVMSPLWTWQANLQAFKEGYVRFLICTDVAARGVDIKGLPYVVNMTLPDEPENYIHRIGRVGRQDCMGLAVSIVAAEGCKEKVSESEVSGGGVGAKPLRRALEPVLAVSGAGIAALTSPAPCPPECPPRCGTTRIAPTAGGAAPTARRSTGGDAPYGTTSQASSTPWRNASILPSRNSARVIPSQRRWRRQGVGGREPRWSTEEGSGKEEAVGTGRS